MSVLYSQAAKSKYRITLDVEVLSDFNPKQIDWAKVLEIQDNESIESYIEDMSNPVSW
tara:strand:- start:512 stop:685 length:174 start_codon:yes stop_codon:yes gene_type:complete